MWTQSSFGTSFVRVHFGNTRWSHARVNQRGLRSRKKYYLASSQILIVIGKAFAMFAKFYIANFHTFAPPPHPKNGSTPLMMTVQCFLAHKLCGRVKRSTSIMIMIIFYALQQYRINLPVIVILNLSREDKHRRIRDQFRLGGLRSVARIFSPLLARKSSGFARILHEFLPENGYLKTSRGLQPPPPHRLVRLCFINDIIGKLNIFKIQGVYQLSVA